MAPDKPHPAASDARVHLGAHWSSDVLGGWAVGATIAAGCGALYERARDLEASVASPPVVRAGTARY